MTDAPELLEASSEMKPLHEYQPIKRPQHFLWLFPVPLALLVLVLTLALADTGLLFVLLGLAITVALLGLTGLAYLLFTLQNDLKITVYADRISHYQKGSTTEIFWRELRDIRISNYRTPRKGFFIGLTEITLLGIDNKSVVIGAFVKDADLLVTIISEVIRLYQMPAQIERLKNGETVSFGAVQLSSAGIHSANRVLSWDDFAYDLLETGHNVYRVIRHGQSDLDLRVWLTVKLRDLENIPLLMALVNHFNHFAEPSSQKTPLPYAALAAQSA